MDRITGISWEYEPARYADPTGEYLPDFVVRGLPYPLFIDVKGPPLADEARATVVRSMMRVWASIPAAALTIWSAATLDSEPFQLVRREAPIILAALWRCTGCGCRAFARAGVQHRPTCKDCSVAA